MEGPALAESTVFADAEALARGAAEWLCALALTKNSRFAVCCSGGLTPKRLYEVLAEPALASRFPWRNVHWFWGDERYVPSDHSASNYRMLRDALLSRVDVPAGNVHPIPTDSPSPENAAAAYETTLRAFHGGPTLAPDRPLFDVTLLGVGEDGHTASLFPEHPAIDEREHWTAVVVGAKSEARVTLTYPALDSSRHAAFLVTGAGKRAIVARIHAGDRTLPAARIRPVGQLHWFTDRSVAI
jgi:6-phosphogluconolactonase